MEYIIAGLMILMVVKEYFSYKANKDIYDRLMSRNFQEYKDNTQQEKNHLEPEEDGTSEIEDSKEDIIYGKEEN